MITYYSTKPRLASLTKPIVSLTAMRLIEQGDITLDDDITRWLPDFRPCLENGEPATIRVRHLLSHMSGLRYRYSAPADSLYHSRNVSDGIDYQPGLTLEENLQRLAGTRLQFRPGTGWRYSWASMSSVKSWCGRPVKACQNW